MDWSALIQQLPQILSLAAALAPVIIGLVKDVETLFPQPGIGTTVKLPLVQSLTQAAIDSKPELADAVKASGIDVASTVAAVATAQIAAMKSAA